MAPFRKLNGRPSSGSGSRGVRTSGLTPELEVLHGHPSTALGQCAREGGYEMIAIGTRGTGITKALLGSAASELARDSKIPVLLVSGQRSLREKSDPAPAASVSPNR